MEYKPSAQRRESTESADDPARVNLQDSDNLDYWREHFGVTTQQLEEAVAAVGGDPGAVREHLLNQGASAGVG